MQSTGKTVLKLTGRNIALALAVGFFSQLSTPALAQGFGPDGLGYPEQSPSMGSTQDSFLPPEVVPQADNGAGQFAMGATPGQLTALPDAAQMNMANMASGNMSAKDMRKAAFESLLGNTQLSNQIPQQYDPAMAQGQNANQMMPSQAQYTIGQPDWLVQGSNPSNDISQYGNSSQTQTLTGGSKVPIVRRDTRKGGFANNLSGGAAMGSGLLFTQLRRPGSLFGLGFTGLTMTGFGVRNGFRF